MFRRVLAVAAVATLAGTVLVAAPGSEHAAATPVATQDDVYEAFGRVFPDPHGCVRGAPDKSPYAKGNVCAAQFVQWNEALEGLGFLQDRFPRHLQLLNLKEQYEDLPDLVGEQLQSAGLPREDLSRDRRDLHVVKVTDRDSPVPEPERRHFAYVLSIHGIERAGLEGGIRAIEDLVTWAACEDPVETAPACAAEGPFPKRILEPSDSGPTAGQVLDGAVIYFVFANPDGWHRGEWSEGGAFFQRYNGNGMDLNRDWPTVGYTEAQYTPGSEPETTGYGKFLKWVKGNTAEGRFAGGIDLHGMVTARSFSFTLLGAGQRDYRKNALSVDTSIKTFRDSEERLSWSPLIAPSDECPGPRYSIPAVGSGNHPMCSDQWGTVWDTINYQVTGSFGDWIDSPMGLDGLGIDNEMALSHLVPNTGFDPDLEQLHIDGNKGLVYSQLASLLEEQPVVFTPASRTAYVFDPDRIADEGGGPADSGLSDLPTQPDTGTEVPVTGLQEFRFEVLGPEDGYHNGGLTVEATSANLRGVSPNAAGSFVLEYCGPDDHPADPAAPPEEDCREVAHYFNQSGLYLQGGARIDLNDPRPGPYRIRPDAARVLPTDFHVSFSRGPAYPEPEQAPYDVSRMDFFSDLNEYAAPGTELTPVDVKTVLTRPKALDRFDSVVVANELMPGFVPARDPSEPEPGTAQDSQDFGVAASEVALPTQSASYEFDVLPTFDNDRMVVTSEWEEVGDYDVHVEREAEPGVWDEAECECTTPSTGETATVYAPEPGRWRVRVENFAATPQDVTGTISFEADPAPQAAPTSRWNEAQLRRYTGALARFAANGGNLVLTDGAMAALSALGTGLAPEAPRSGVFYAGWMDFDDGSGPTYERHPLAAAVNKEGTAEGQDTVDGQTFDNRHQTYEPVPLGYYVSPDGSGNDSCTGDRCDSPNWIVDEAAWRDAGGTVAARTLVRESAAPGSDSTTGVSLGELPFGDGVIRVAGALLPDPTEANHHPFGLASYALTYTGYQVFENLLMWQRPANAR